MAGVTKEPPVPSEVPPLAVAYHVKSLPVAVSVVVEPQATVKLLVGVVFTGCGLAVV